MNTIQPEFSRINEILVFKTIVNVTNEQITAIRENIKEQLADDARFIVALPHINVYYLQPGDSAESPLKKKDAE